MSETVIITGTSSGIGFELTKIFAENDYQVIAISRNTKTLKAVNHPNVKIFKVDLKKETDIDSVIDFLSEKKVKISTLIHNAGVLINKPFEKISQQDFLEVYQVNVFSLALLTQKTIPFLQKNSHVVTISSMGGIQGSAKFSGLSAYSSSKGAVITLTELLAEEYKEKKIFFNTLALGAVQTEMLQKAFPNYKALIKAKEMANYIYHFSVTGHKFYNGKILQISNSTP